MGRLAKIRGLLYPVVLLVFVGLDSFIRGPLTDGRVKEERVIPRATQAFDRTLAISDINVGLLRSICLDDFVTMKSFILNSDLLPLLQKIRAQGNRSV